jgi:hypothetical protein
LERFVDQRSACGGIDSFAVTSLHLAKKFRWYLVAASGRAKACARPWGEAHRIYTRQVNFRKGSRGYLRQGRFASM